MESSRRCTRHRRSRRAPSRLRRPCAPESCRRPDFASARQRRNHRHKAWRSPLVGGRERKNGKSGDNLPRGAVIRDALPISMLRRRRRRARRISKGRLFMSIDSVRRFFHEKAPDIVVMEAAGSTATVAPAAAAHGGAPAQIAKTLSLRVGGAVFLLVTGGSARRHNAKAKATFGGKTRMLPPHELEALTGHPVRSEEHTSELQSRFGISYAVF